MVHYRGKFHPGLGRDHQLVTGVEFLAMLIPHINLRHEISARCYGAISTTLRRRFGWIKEESKEAPQNVIAAEEDGDSEFVKVRKRNWAKLISKVWLENPELCPRCGKKMEIVSAISSPAQDDIIEKILKHLDLWDPPWKRVRPPRGPPPEEQSMTQEIVPDPWCDEDENQDPPGDSWMD